MASSSRTWPWSRRRSRYDFFGRHQRYIRPRSPRGDRHRRQHALDALLAFTRRHAAPRSCSAATKRPRRSARACRPPSSSPGTTRPCGRCAYDPTITYLQVLYPFPDQLELVERIHARFGDEVPAHLEFVRFDGKVTCFGAAAGALHHRGAARRDHAHPRGHGRADLQPAPLHAGGRRHEADRRGPARLQARGRPARACSTRAR